MNQRKFKPITIAESQDAVIASFGFDRQRAHIELYQRVGDQIKQILNVKIDFAIKSSAIDEIMGIILNLVYK